MRKLLIYSIIIVVSIISVLLANYALVFPATANIVTSIAILMSLVHLFLTFIHPNGWLEKEKHFLGMWAGPLLFTMHKIISPISIFLLLWSQPFLVRWMRVEKSEDGKELSLLKKWKKSSFEIMLITFTFWGLDMLREFTVWHEFQIRIIPSVLTFMLFLNWMIFRKNNTTI
ncbi:MAG: hypothetical protein IPO63_07095 [Bacteroidetes bacterium]|nr:hypothetical protein [Bacteroidota bacterium]